MAKEIKYKDPETYIYVEYVGFVPASEIQKNRQNEAVTVPAEAKHEVPTQPPFEFLEINK